MSVELSIAPTLLRDFLKSQGWQVLQKALADRLFVLSNPAYPRRQLVFPMDLTAPDYMESTDLVIGKLAGLTDVKPQSLLNRIQSANDDVMRLRVFFDGDDHHLPLSFACSLVQSTEKLLKAAACTVLRPRIYHPRLTLSEAAQFVEEAKFGQTELGSFILRVACPINAMAVQGTLEFDDSSMPFVRQVTLSLHKALSQLTSAIEGDTVDRLVEDLKRASAIPLISSNLCEALSDMHDERVDNSLDLGFDWSVLKHVPQSVTGRPILIQRDYFSRIEEIRRELRSSEVGKIDTFIGTVERLDGEMGVDGNRSGGVVLSLLLRDEGETVRARTVLDVQQYKKADAAHMTSGAYIRVVGRLLPGRQPRQLAEVQHFDVL
jgi:hypothetical protein